MDARRLLLALVALLLLGPLPAAGAVPRERSLDARFRLRLEPAPGREDALPVTRAMTMWVPAGVRTAGGRMPSCTAETIEQRGAPYCPRRSRVGSGTARGYIYESYEPLTIDLFNGGGALLAHVRGTSPVSIDVVVRGTVTRPRDHRYGRQLSFPFPDALIYPVPGSTAALVSMSARLFGRAGWLRSRSCPPTGWSLGAELTDVSGALTHIDADLRCV